MKSLAERFDLFGSCHSRQIYEVALYLRVMLKIDLRSDTVTRPTAGMLKAMMESPVGDDVLGDDPTVALLEATMAERFGVEAALFCQSGTQANQIALMCHLQPGDEVICHPMAHIYLYEGGGVAANSHASVRMAGDSRGIMRPEDVLPLIQPDDVHFPRTRVLAVENTSNKGGGTCYTWAEIEDLRKVATDHGLVFHLDGARLYNAMIATGTTEKQWGQTFDTISICLSKGLGTPGGSVLLGSAAAIHKARRIRKRIGGAWRQGGYFAGAALYALEHHIDRLALDHRAAKEMATYLESLPYIKSVVWPETNILLFGLHRNEDQGPFMEWLKARGIGVSQMGPGKIRMVFHLGVTEAHLAEVREVLQHWSL